MSTLSLSVGEYSRLQRSSSNHDVFNIVALDHQDSLKRALNSSNPSAVSRNNIIRFKHDVVHTLNDEMEGVLLDAPTGVPAVIPSGLAKSKGLLVAIERSDYSLEPMPLELEIEPGWSVSNISLIGADGVKLFIYDDPSKSEVTEKQNALIRQIKEECRSYSLPLYSEPIVVMSDPKLSYTERVISAALRQQELGATILKLEFPIDVQQYASSSDWIAACRDLSSAVDIPWVLLSAGVDFSSFSKQLQIACKSGASGYIVGRALWGEATAISSCNNRQSWLQNVALNRLRILSAIANSNARPWLELYSELTLNEGWYLKV